REPGVVWVACGIGQINKRVDGYEPGMLYHAPVCRQVYVDSKPFGRVASRGDTYGCVHKTTPVLHGGHTTRNRVGEAGIVLVVLELGVISPSVQPHLGFRYT